MDTKKKIKPITIYIDELENKSSNELKIFFENIFRELYNEYSSDIIEKYSLRCVQLISDIKDYKLYFPNKILVSKKNKKIVIKNYKNKVALLFLSLIIMVFMLLLETSYSVINYNEISKLNKDTNGDEIPDINITSNNSKIPKINVDTNNDLKPDINIDYEKNRKPIFNVDKNEDNKADFNLTNQDNNKDGICDVNCDIDNDGEPDINLDLNGDGIIDLNKDINNDRKAELNFDTNLDGICDKLCDTNNDNICDLNCIIENESVILDDLILEYEDGKELNISKILPDDQPGYENVVPTKKFKITNKSKFYSLTYNLRWVVTSNDYITDNFKYRLSRIEGNKYNTIIDYMTVPKINSVIQEKITIAPLEVQEYEINFKLQGIGSEQNEDQGRTFSGYVEVYIDI